MANCKICGKPVRAARVLHAACWEKAAEEMAQVFCDEYCRWPREVGSQEELEQHCDSCLMNRLAELGV